MERLTWRDATGRALLAAEYNEKYDAMELIDILLDRLGAYEDTGLEPEQVFALQMHLDHAYADYVRALWHDIGGMERMEAVAKAEREGRLLVLPCKVGDTMYAIKDGKVRDVFVINFSLHEWHDILLMGLLFDHRKTNGVYNYPVSDIGKTIFLTREEAEQQRQCEVRRRLS